MQTVENVILQLAEEIYAGKCSYKKAVLRLDAIEKKYGALEINVAYPEYPNMASKDYMDELIGRVRVGLYSKQLLIDLSRAANDVYGGKSVNTKNKKTLIIGIAVAAVAVIATIIAISTRG